jgi:hypothetical protein
MAMTGDEAKQLQAVFQELGFMNNIKPEVFKELSQRFNKITFERGDSVLKQGRSGGAFFILARGTISIWADKGSDKIQVASIKPTTYFGEIALLEGSERIATLIAEDNVEVFSLGKKDFFEILFSIPQIKNKIEKTAGSRKKETDSKLVPGEEVTFPDRKKAEEIVEEPPFEGDMTLTIPVTSLYREDAIEEAPVKFRAPRTAQDVPVPPLSPKEEKSSPPPLQPSFLEHEKSEPAVPEKKETRIANAAEVVWGLHDEAGLMSEETTEILKFIISNDTEEHAPVPEEDKPVETPPKAQGQRKVIPFPKQKKS